jgi:hypothetical protein
VSQTFGATQSLMLAQLGAHAPPTHTYGAQSFVWPAESTTVCPSLSHAAPAVGVHMPFAPQRYPGVQSPSAAQLGLHWLSVPQTRLPAHGFAGPATQWPWASQLLSVTVLPLHAVAHDVVDDGYVQSVLVPLHAPPHVVPAPAHGERVPCGAPITGQQLPSCDATSHASHAPAHAPLQQ